MTPMVCGICTFAIHSLLILSLSAFLYFRRVFEGHALYAALLGGNTSRVEQLDCAIIAICLEVIGLHGFCC